MICLNMFSRCRRVASDNDVQALTSRYLSISQASEPAVGPVLRGGALPETAVAYSVSNSEVPNAALILILGPCPTRT